MYALRDEHGNTKHSLNETIIVAEGFYARLYARTVMPGDTTEPELRLHVPLITKEEIGRALKGMKRVKASGEDGISVGLLEGGDLVLEKLAKRFSEWLRTPRVPIA